MRPSYYAVALCLALVLPAAAETPSQEVLSLAGLPGLEVMTDGPAPNPFLSKDDVRVMAELALRRSGIRVLSQEESIATRASPVLVVTVSIGPYNDQMRLYAVSVMVRQNATLRNGLPMFAVPTWEAPGTSGIASRATIASTIRGELDLILTRLCNDFLRANPPPVQPASRNLGKRHRDLKIQEVDPEPETATGAVR